MYHTRAQITQRLLQNENARPTHNILVIGIFPINGDGSSTLSQLLVKTSAQIITASACAPSTARVRLRFRSKRLWAKTSTSIDQISSKPVSAIIFPEGLGLHHIEKPRWQNRKMEEWRRFLLAYRVAARSNRCAFVVDQSAKWFTFCIVVAIFLRHPLKSKLCFRISAYPKLIKWITRNKNYCLPDGFNGFEAYPPRITLKRIVDKLEREHPARALLIADLRWVHSVAETLRRTSQPLFSSIRTTQVDMAKINAANRIPTEHTLSVFMQHFLAKSKLHNFSDRHTEFAVWYMHSPVNRKSETALPIPLPLLKSEFIGSDGTTPEILHGPILNIASGVEYGPYDVQNITGRSAFLVEMILDLARRCENLSYLPQRLLEYFRAPVGNIAGNISRMELMCFTISGHRVVEEPWNSEIVTAWFQETVCKNAPSMTIFSTTAKKYNHTTDPISVHILGINGDQSGLARNTQMSAEAFTAANIPNFIDDRPFNRAWEQFCTKNARPLNQPVTIHHVNADQIPMQILAASKSIHIGFLLWELEQVPQSHMLAGEMLDEVWVPSSYVQDIYSNIYDCKVVNIGKGFSLPEVDAANMSEYGISEGQYVYLMCFDAHSSVERKNPLAAVLAFVSAFPNNPNVKLLIKTTPVSPAHWGDPNGQMKQIRQIARRDPRVIVDERMLPFTKLLSLIKRADCIVSPHRAEGFGYIPAYAMWFGRPVIVTDYFGTQEICSAKTAFPVPYKLIKARNCEIIKPVENAHWADIEIETLSQTFREVRNDPIKARKRALHGQNLLQTKFSTKMQSKRYLNRFVELGLVTK